jgi:hypothetical protein
MTALVPTFVREGNQILAFFEDRIIARGTDFKKVEESAVDYLDKVDAGLKSSVERERKASATHITTPNGLKGEILSNVEGQWGEKLITVRLENNRIVRLAAHGDNDKDIEYQTIEAAASESALDYLESTLNEVPEGTKSSLANRITVLDGLVVKVAALQSTASYEDSKKLDDIALQARHEKVEVQEALAHLESADAEAFQSPAPFRVGAVEQASVGGGSGSWLDATVDEMVRESDAQDFDKLLIEEPVLFVAGLDLGALAEAGTTREMALSHIVSKTASYQGEAIDAYREKFLASVEMARREELKDRTKKAEKKAKKTAKKEKKANKVPDDALFL